MTKTAACALTIVSANFLNKAVVLAGGHART